MASTLTTLEPRDGSSRIWSTVTKTTDHDLRRRMEALENSVKQLTEIVSTLIEMRNSGSAQAS